MIQKKSHKNKAYLVKWVEKLDYKDGKNKIERRTSWRNME